MRYRRSAHHNLDPSVGPLVARFPGQHCTRCGGEFIPGESEIEVDPAEQGPKGGKRYMHAHGCAKSNPVKRRVRARDLRDMDDMTPSEIAEMKEALYKISQRQAEEALRDFYERKVASPAGRSKQIASAAARAKQPVRRNFGAMFGQKYDLAQHAEKARELATPYRRLVQDFLVHAPGKGGRGEAWYWLRGLQLRDFEEAPLSSLPTRYFTAKSPWSQMRSTLNEYGKYVRPNFVLIDTFTGEVEGPLSAESIHARRNPRRGHGHR